MTTRRRTADLPTNGTGVGLLGRGSVVFATLIVQVVAFGAAFLLDRPTLYALFAMASAAALVGLTGGGLRGVGLAAAGAAATAVIGWLAGSLWIVIAGPVVLTATVGVGEAEWTWVAAATLGTVLLIALGLPLALFVARQNLATVIETVRSSEVHLMLFLSVYAPFLAAAVTLLFGVPLARLLARGFPGRSLVESLVDLPLVVPHSVAGLLVLFGFGEGAAFPDLSILTSMAGMVLAMVFVSAPFAVNIAREAFEAVDEDVERAARIHGASRWETFRRVEFPLAARGVLTGGVMAWARAVSEFGAVAVVAYNVDVLVPGLRFTNWNGLLPVDWVSVGTSQHAPVFIFNEYTTGGLVESSAVGFVLLAVSVVIFLLVRWLAYDGADAGVTP
jgi:molybdate/tungstate transport system permease protein